MGTSPPGTSAGSQAAAALAGRIEAAWSAIAGRRDALLEWEVGGGPASAPADPEADWDPGRILAHLSEMVRYWLGEIERVLAGGGRPVSIGRTADDPVRVLTVERDRAVPVRELLDRTGMDVGRVVARLRSLDDGALAMAGLHPVRGEMRVATVVESTLAKHLEDHALQLDEALGGRG